MAGLQLQFEAGHISSQIPHYNGTVTLANNTPGTWTATASFSHIAAKDDHSISPPTVTLTAYDESTVCHFAYQWVQAIACRMFQCAPYEVRISPTTEWIRC